MKPPLEPYLTMHVAEMQARSDALRLKPLRDKTISHWAIAFALAFLYPHNLEEIALAHGIDPATLEAALLMLEGQRIAHAMIGRLRANGDLERDQALRLKQTLIDLIKSGVAQGTVATSFAPKVLEIVSKMSDARPGSADPVLPPTRFNGTGAELIATINVWVDAQSGMPSPVPAR